MIKWSFNGEATRKIINNEVVIEFLFIQRKVKKNIEENTRRKRSRSHDQEKGTWVNYVRGRYYHPSRPLYSTRSTLVILIKGCVTSKAYKLRECMKWIVNKQKESFCYCAPLGFKTSCLRIPLCNRESKHHSSSEK